MITQIKFEEIRKGDKIRAISPIGTVRKGRIEELQGCCWVDAADEEIVCVAKAGTNIIHLLDRPAPPLPTTPGTAFRATEIRGEQCDVTVMVREPYPGGGTVMYLSSHFIAACDTHSAKHITAWEPIEANNA